MTIIVKVGVGNGVGKDTAFEKYADLRFKVWPAT